MALRAIVEPHEDGEILGSDPLQAVGEEKMNNSSSNWKPTIVVYGQPALSSTYYPSYTPDSRLYSWPTPIAPPAGQDLFIAWCPGLTNSHVVPGSAYCMPIAPLPAYVPSSAVHAPPGQPAVSVTVAGATAT